MSSAPSSNATDVQLPLALEAFIEGIKPAMFIFLFCTVWLGIAIPLLVILFYTSSSNMRKTAIFISNAIGIGIGIVLGVLNAAILVRYSFRETAHLLILLRPTDKWDPQSFEWAKQA